MAGKLDKEGIMIKILFEKVKKLLLSPHEEWRAIAAEELSIQDMFIKYAAYLALIPAVSMIIGFGIVPSLGFLSILGLYSVYLLFVGIPILLKVPEDKTMPFIIAVVISSLVLGILLNAVVGQFVYGPIYSDLLTY